MNFRVGIIGILNRTFPGDLDAVYGRFIEDTASLSKELGFSVVSPGKALDNLEEVRVVLDRFRHENIDFLLVQICSIASGKIMEAIARAGFPLGIWGLPEPADEGAVQLNSLCGLTMFCSIIQTFLKNEPIRYKWFYGSRQDREFIDRFKPTIKALKLIEQLKGVKAAIVGGIAPGFLNVYADRRKLESRFGIEVDELDFSELRDAVERAEVGDATKRIAGEMESEVDAVSADVKDKLEQNAILYETIDQFARDRDYRCLAISCWPRFRMELGMMPCAAYGRLTDHGIVAACEGDIEGALSMYILRALAGSSPIIADFTHANPEKGAIQYWHCGNAPVSCGKKGTVELTTHFKPGSRITCGDDEKVGTVYDMVFAAGQYTVFRLMDDGTKCLLISGEMLEDELGPGFDGTRGWLGKLKYNHRELPFWALVQTILTRGIPHHHCLVKGNLVDELTECMSWLGVEIIEPIEYTNTIC